MIDIHCHILPGLDDGPHALDESVEMCKIAAADGITTVVATPHIRNGINDCSSRTAGLLAELNSTLQQQDIRVSILSGAEVAVTPELPLLLRTADDLTINRSGKYFLSEFPPDFVPPQWDVFLLSFLEKSMTPIIAHPERNRWFRGHPDALYSFVNRGGMLQITAASLTGECGEDLRQFSVLLLTHNLAHIIATDAHDSTTRPPLLSQALRAAGEIIGRESAIALVTSNPEGIIEGRKISLPEPIPVVPGQKKKTWIQKLTSL